MYEKQIEIIQKIRETVPKFAHYKEFTGRVRPFLQEALPEYTIAVSNKEGCLTTGYSIRVWGNGLRHDNDGVYIRWNAESDKTWVEGLLTALEQADPSDSRERDLQELELTEELDRLNSEVKSLIKRARMLVKELPVPKSAITRNDPMYWENASTELRKRYPILFGYNVEMNLDLED